MKTIVVIAGPTASGKSKLAIKCAQSLNGEVISADSMQIYKDLNIGTAKPTPDEQREAVHHLIDIADAKDEFSVQQFVKLAEQKIEEISSRGKLPIVCGGTGLYIKSLLFPHSFACAPKNLEIRQKYQNMLSEFGKEYLHKILTQKDPISAQKIHTNDTKKVIRALEICDITGKPKSEQSDALTPKYNVAMIVLCPAREDLYANINSRVDNMLKMGLVEEVKHLLQAKLVTPASQSMQAIGYKEVLQFLQHNLTLEQTVDQIKKNSRNYAKRQITFFKSFADSIWVSTPMWQNGATDATVNLIRQQLHKLEQNKK